MLDLKAFADAVEAEKPVLILADEMLEVATELKRLWAIEAAARKVVEKSDWYVPNSPFIVRDLMDKLGQALFPDTETAK